MDQAYSRLSTTHGPDSDGHAKTFPATEAGTDDSGESDSEDECSQSPAAHLDTYLQPEEGVIVNCTVNLAPGEGQRPLSFRSDSKSEVLSFPKKNSSILENLDLMPKDHAS